MRTVSMAAARVPGMPGLLRVHGAFRPISVMQSSSRDHKLHIQSGCEEIRVGSRPNTVSACGNTRSRSYWVWRVSLFWILVGTVLAASGCMSVITNPIEMAMAGGEPHLGPPLPPGQGMLAGQVVHEGEPVADAVVLVAQPAGTPHVTHTDAEGHYLLTGLPQGSYVPIAGAPGFEYGIPRSILGLPISSIVQDNVTAVAPVIELELELWDVLAPVAAEAYSLKPMGSYVAETPFPKGARAQVHRWTFEREKAVNDSLYLYLPLDAGPEDQIPMLLALYPNATRLWEDISVGFASQGFGVVAMSPIGARGRNVTEHALDARLILQFASQGLLDPRLDSARLLAISGSYGAAILNKLIRISDREFAAVVTLGGISNAFTGAAAFYSGELEWPLVLRYALAMLGTANERPDGYMQYAPVYSASEMPPILLIHTLKDEMVPLSQSLEYELALRAAGVPVETIYFEDESHYLKLGARTSDTTRYLFASVLEFLHGWLEQPSDA